MSGKCFKVVVFFLIILLLWERVHSQFHLTCSDYNSTSNRYYLPNFGGRENVLNQTWESLVPGVTYIYPVVLSAINCSGTIEEVEFCYSSPIYTFSNELIFYLYYLSVNGADFTVLENITVYSSPDESKCVSVQNHLRCCDVMGLGGVILPTTVENISMGISIPQSSYNITLQSLHSAFNEYDVQVYLLTVRPANTQFQVNVNPIPRPFPFIWFHINLGTQLHLSFIVRKTENPTHFTNMTTESMVDNARTVIHVVVGAAGELAALGIILTLPLIIVLMKLRRKKQRKKYKCDLSESMYTNPLYMEDKNQVGGTNTGHHKRIIAVLEDPNDDEDKSNYEYVETSMMMESQFSNKNEEVDYTLMVPPNDFSQLYSHLEGFRTDALTRDKIRLGKELGSGQFGRVFEGVWECPEEEVKVAVKTLDDQCRRIQFLKEATIMNQFKHNNVVALHGVIISGDPTLLVMEMLEGGDLKKYLLSMRSGMENELTEDLKAADLLGYCRQISCGMTYLSGKAFVHRNLAARNILVSGDRTCKIAGFGTPHKQTDSSSGESAVLIKWTAPEAVHYKRYSTASDVWSYGVVMYEIWSVGHEPFEGVSSNKALQMIDSGYRLPPPPGCPHTIYSIMVSCWNLLVDERPTFSHIYKQLSSSDAKLLQVSEKGEFGSDAFKLGTDLKCASNLHKDLQRKYRKSSAQ